MAWYHHVSPDESINKSFEDFDKMMAIKRLVHDFDSCCCNKDTCPQAFADKPIYMWQKVDAQSKRIMEEHFPVLPPLELAVALNACKDAGAVNAATALGKYITRLELEVGRLNRLVDTFNEMIYENQNLA